MWADVSVVIPNFNGAGFILQSLQAVTKAADYYPGNVHIIVVDDGSTDNSVSAIGNRFPEIKLITKNANAGFAQAVKTGMQTAYTEWVVLLNSDVYPAENFLHPLMRWVEMADLFAVGCRVTRSDGTVEKVSWVRRQLKWGVLVTLPWQQQEYDQLLARGQAAPTLFTSGGSMLVSRDKFLQLDGFLPLFEPFYYEDVDLGIRAWRRGWRVLAEPASQVVHDSGQTIDQLERARRVGRIKKRNRLYIDWLHASRPTVWLQLLPRLVMKSVGWLIKGRWLELGALSDALRQFWRVLATGRNISAISRYTLCEALKISSQLLVIESPVKIYTRMQSINCESLTSQGTDD